MIIILKCTILLLFVQIISSGQISPGAKQISLSHSTVASTKDVFSIFTNPSGLALLNWREIGIYYSPAPFGLSELANASAAFNEPTSFGSFGIGFITYGFELYRENKLSLAYANKFENIFMLGVSATYQNISIDKYGEDNSILFLLGGLVFLHSDLRFGFSIYNITRSTYGDEDNQIPVIYRTGLSYDMFNNLSVSMALEKEIDRPVSLRFGIDYLIIEYINLRLGFNNEPASFSAGIGINYSMFEFDYAAFNHQDLGFTHQFGLIVHFSNNSPRNERIKDNLNLK